MAGAEPQLRLPCWKATSAIPRQLQMQNPCPSNVHREHLFFRLRHPDFENLAGLTWHGRDSKEHRAGLGDCASSNTRPATHVRTCRAAYSSAHSANHLVSQQKTSHQAGDHLEVGASSSTGSTAVRRLPLASRCCSLARPPVSPDEPDALTPHPAFASETGASLIGNSKCRNFAHS
ncbi:hypothetical protein BDW02DRAFT_382704 [Decorospora gaudefroyi]|uniref:Uncharacterized protein n=1 Tax=Decorospora gaudefroyi TaxID=184978 RepID=A0A6A5KAV4_9PLEO|nr:hypothetical protein BDW02DRAFT_382704 [Decorospora gaudefroyi]